MSTFKRNHHLKLWVGIVLVCIGVLLTYNVKAEDNLLLGGISHHFTSESYTNSNHRVFGYLGEKYVASYFRNSHDQDSFMAGYVLTNDYERTKLQLFLGGIHGYDRCFGAFSEEDKAKGKKPKMLCPMIAPALTFKTDFIVDPILMLFGDALVLSAKYKF